MFDFLKLDKGELLASLAEMKQFFSVCSGVRVVLFLGLTHFSLAQSGDTPIIDQTPASVKKADDAIIAKVNELRKDKKLLSHDEVKKQLLNPKPRVAASESKSIANGRSGCHRTGYEFAGGLLLSLHQM